MEYSTPVTANLCKAVLQDYVKVVVDLENHRKKLRLTRMSRAAIDKFDTGGWQLIHRATTVGVAEGLNPAAIQCVGVPVCVKPAKQKRKSAPAKASARPSVHVHTTRPMMRQVGAAAEDEQAQVLSPAQRIKESMQHASSRQVAVTQLQLDL